MRWLPGLLLAALLGCNSERASADQCRIISNRLIALELKAMGFNDTALAERRQAEFAARYRDELASCVGRRLPPGAMTCVMSAKNAEVISHDCLR